LSERIAQREPEEGTVPTTMRAIEAEHREAGYDQALHLHGHARGPSRSISWSASDEPAPRRRPQSRRERSWPRSSHPPDTSCGRPP